MDKEKQGREQQIFKILDKGCEPYSTPIPDKLFNINLKCEVWGFMSRLIGNAFQNMRDTDGNSNWECNAKGLLGTKQSEKRTLTLNSMRKYLMECQGADLIEYAKEVGDEITVKINVTFLFEKCLLEKQTKE